MGSVGLPEVMVIFIVALLVLGPDKLPNAARQVGRAYSEFRRITNGFQDEVRDALDMRPTEPGTPVRPAEDPPASSNGDVPPPRD
jgi:Tat protein translocase TatB subunit